MTCETMEMELSAVIDGEVEAGVLPDLLDHLVECAECRAFYRAARSLDDGLVVAGLRRAEAPPQLWERIEETAGLSRPRVPAWMWRAAAAAVIGIGLWAVGALRLPVAVPLGDEVDVSVEANRGDMSEDDFIRLTTRLLESDRRYHLKMMEILSVVNARTFVPETRADRAQLAAVASGGTAAERAAGDETRSAAARYW